MVENDVVDATTEPLEFTMRKCIVWFEEVKLPAMFSLYCPGTCVIILTARTQVSNDVVFTGGLRTKRSRTVLEITAWEREVVSSNWLLCVFMVAMEFVTLVRRVSSVLMLAFIALICASCWLNLSFISASSVRERFEFIALFICAQDIISALSLLGCVGYSQTTLKQ